MKYGIVLDAAAFDVIDGPDGAGLRALIAEGLRRGGELRTTAVTLAEVCRGTDRTRRAENAVARDRGGHRIRIIETDLRLAKLVGAILTAADRGSTFLGDAHVVAACVDLDLAVVITADPDDITALSEAIPGVRVVTRDPSVPAA